MAVRGKVRTGDFRKPIPMGIRLRACLLLLGFSEEEINTPGAIQWDHSLALVNREFDEEAGDWVPAQHDPRFIAPMSKFRHAEKTYGPGNEKRIHKRLSDISEPLRLDRLSEDHEAFRRRLATPGKPPKPKSKWPKRKLRK